MALVNRFFKFPSSEKNSYDKFVHVTRENFGIIVCTLLVPKRPHTKKSTVIWDPSDLEGSVEISEADFQSAMKSI